MFRTLLIEDSHLYRRLLKEILQVRFPEMEILEAKDGEEALTSIASHPPHLIFMDVKLPKLSGLELTRKIKDLYPEITIIILTSYDLPEYREAASQYRANHFLSKSSATKEGILSLVESILSKHHLHRR
ncbi:MAG: response regulator transcription factor [Thermodesulfobacteriota bacterium]